ncbi:dethiobiotin synthase [Spongiibacter thalassae]|nr:dethiobiotin synthase [Spongiibacter thalassae]
MLYLVLGVAMKLKSKTYFIAGTDTDAGKTLSACGLLRRADKEGLRTLAVKPVAAGAVEVDGKLRNDDALNLSAAINQPLSYEQLNPVVFAPPIAPHIAAAKENRRITASQLAGYCRGVMMRPADMVLVEGAGGWRVPLSGRETMADLAVALQAPVILVVGLKLGCINHALLTVEAIQRDGLVLAGWIANQIDAHMSHAAENIDTLTQLIPAPCLGVVPFLDDVEGGRDASAFLNLSTLRV